MQTHKHMKAGTHNHAHTHTHARMHALIHSHTHTHRITTDEHMQTYTCIHEHIRTHTHTHACIPSVLTYSSTECMDVTNFCIEYKRTGVQVYVVAVGLQWNCYDATVRYMYSTIKCLCMMSAGDGHRDTLCGPERCQVSRSTGCLPGTLQVRTTIVVNITAFGHKLTLF